MQIAVYINGMSYIGFCFFSRFFCSSPAESVAQSVRRRASHGGETDTNTLHILSWNIDGLCGQFTNERAAVVCDVIDERKPEVVYLQEIVGPTWNLLTKRLENAYFLYRDEEIATSWHYFCVLLIRKNSAVVPKSNHPEILRFPESQQKRYLIQMRVNFRGIPIHLLTSHLESLVRYAGERKNQLRTCFRIMKEELGREPRGTSILGGDLNLMDKELAQICGLPDDFYDVWERCGSDYSEKYTWDSSEPRFRLDRLLCCASQDVKLVPSLFQVVGRDKVQRCGDMHPSDHLGIWAEFELHP